jgi:AhpD family alkylhydroperoxidase
MQRLSFFPQFPQAFEKINEIEGLVKQGSLDPLLIHLVKIRASQINGCAFCVDMHHKEAKIDGERELRLYHIAVWEESPLFTPKEKAALLWTEQVTKLSQGAVSDETFARVKELFSDKELTELTMAIAMINAWNRFAAPFRSVPGSMDTYLGLEKAGL